MTNEQIIFNKRLNLMKSGIIGTTGQKIILENKDGEKTEVMEPEEIHTYVGWKNRGFQVLRGQKAISDFPIWKHTTKKSKKTDQEEEESMFLTKAYFFSQRQVEPMKET